MSFIRNFSPRNSGTINSTSASPSLIVDSCRSSRCIFNFLVFGHHSLRHRSALAGNFTRCRKAVIKRWSALPMALSWTSLPSSLASSIQDVGPTLISSAPFTPGIAIRAVFSAACCARVVAVPERTAAKIKLPIPNCMRWRLRDIDSSSCPCSLRQEPGWKQSTPGKRGVNCESIPNQQNESRGLDSVPALNTGRATAEKRNQACEHKSKRARSGVPSLIANC